MHSLNRRLIVPYGAKQLFALINDIESYPQFLPWCSDSRIISVQDNEVVASLDVVWQGIHKSFTTRNQLQLEHSVDITLISGPLRHLRGSWKLRDLSHNFCEVTLNLEFAFMGYMLDFLFEPIFKYIANALVEAFTQRAHDIYGKDAKC